MDERRGPAAGSAGGLGDPIDGGRHAVVVGGSMTGLLAARVLLDHFDRVTVVERDRYPAGPAARPGVPQGRHTHLLLARGRALLEALFPGLDEELAAAGAPLLDWTADCRYFSFGGWKPVFRSGHTSRTCSRELLDWVVHRRLAGRARLRLLDGHEVTGLLGDGRRIAGVSIRPRPGGDPTATPGGTAPADRRPLDPAMLAADLVVDASGRGSRTPEWLTALGYEAPA
jgi:2-polyprenyl-6-methoxyphenol hydroxylase-like FAD-dependent oxidoreductase